MNNSVSRRILQEVATIVTPETLLAGHPKLIAGRYDGSKQRGPGRPRTRDGIEKLVVRMAIENRDWKEFLRTEVRDAAAALSQSP